MKVKIVETLDRKEEQAIALEEKTLKEVKLLLADFEGDKKTVLRHLGMDHVAQVAEKQTEEAIIKANFRQKHGKGLTHIQDIKALCETYDLRFLSTKHYAGAIDNQVAGKIIDFCKREGLDYTNQHYFDGKFFIMAPTEAFNLSKTKRYIAPSADPSIFFKVDNDLYYRIYSWGNDFTVFRALNALIKRNQGWEFSLTLLFSALLMLTGALFAIPVTTVAGVLFQITVTLAIGFIIACIKTFNARDKKDSEDSLYYTKNSWASNEVYSRV